MKIASINGSPIMGSALAAAAASMFSSVYTPPRSARKSKRPKLPHPNRAKNKAARVARKANRR